MDSERQLEHGPSGELSTTFDEKMLLGEHADRLTETLGLIRGKLIDGAYDVLRNRREDLLEVTSNGHRYAHRLTRDEADQLERAIWSAGEDQTLANLLAAVEHGLRTAGFNLTGDHLDITVCLREAEPDQTV